MDIVAYLRSRRQKVDAALKAEASAWQERVPKRLAEAMGYSLLAGGKRIRPTLCFAAYEASGGKEEGTPLVWDLALALEFIHTYSLIHDDLPAMDDDDLRRGMPTCHILHGEAAAILAGDALLTEAFALLSRGGEAERLRLVALLANAAGAAGMVGGQQLDLEMEGAAKGEKPPLEGIEAIHRRKTGALLTAAVEGGGIAAKASEEAIASLRAYGQALGLAFQIADDILDEVGDPQAMGKHGGSDKARGKPTYPVLVGLDGARKLAKEAKEKAIEALEGWGPSADPLRSLASYVVERTE